MRILRGGAGVLVGMLFWGGLWQGAWVIAMGMFPDDLAVDRPVTSIAALLFFIVYSIALSVGAGFLTALVQGERPMPAVMILAVIHTAIGIGVQYSVWDLMPVWYHLIFLAAVMPATLAGGLTRALRAAPMQDPAATP